MAIFDMAKNIPAIWDGDIVVPDIPCCTQCGRPLLITDADIESGRITPEGLRLRALRAMQKDISALLEM